MKISSRFIAVLLLGVFLAACSSNNPSPTIDNNGIIGTIVSATLSAIPSDTTLPTLTPSSTPDLLATWETYHSETYGFSFRYPSDKFNNLEADSCVPQLFPNGCEGQNTPGENLVVLWNTILPPDDGSQAAAMRGWLFYEITITPVDANTILSKWVGQNWPNQDQATQVDITIDGVDAIKFYRPNIEPKTNVYVFLIVGNNLIRISGHYANPQNSPSYEQIKAAWLETTDNLISSFRFAK